MRYLCAEPGGVPGRAVAGTRPACPARTEPGRWATVVFAACQVERAGPSTRRHDPGSFGRLTRPRDLVRLKCPAASEALEENFLGCRETESSEVGSPSSSPGGRLAVDDTTASARCHQSAHAQTHRGQRDPPHQRPPALPRQWLLHLASITVQAPLSPAG